MGNGNGNRRPTVALVMERASEALSRSEYLVLVAIASFADSDGRAWPSYGAIARRARVSEATVKRAIRGLEGAGELVVFSRGSGRRTNAYVVVAAQTTRVTKDDPSERAGLGSNKTGLGSNGASTRVTMDDLGSPYLEDQQIEGRGEGSNVEADPPTSEDVYRNGNGHGNSLAEIGRVLAEAEQKATPRTAHRREERGRAVSAGGQGARAQGARAEGPLGDRQPPRGGEIGGGSRRPPGSEGDCDLPRTAPPPYVPVVRYPATVRSLRRGRRSTRDGESLERVPPLLRRGRGSRKLAELPKSSTSIESRMRRDGRHTGADKSRGSRHPPRGDPGRAREALGGARPARTPQGLSSRGGPARDRARREAAGVSKAGTT
jgi:DNA-binding MarR family transcriptional regulator